MLRLFIFQGVRRAGVHVSLARKRPFQYASLQPRVVQSGLLDGRSMRGFHATNPLASDIEARVKRVIEDQLGVKSEEACPNVDPTEESTDL